MSAYHWIIALLLATGIHAAALSWQPGGEDIHYGALGEGEDGIEIGLGQAGSYADQLKKQEPPKPVSVAEPKPAPKKPIVTKPVVKTTVEKPKAIAQPAAKTTPAENTYAVQKASKKTEPLIPTPKPAPQQPEPENAEQPSEEPAETEQEQKTEAAERQKPADAKTEQTATASTDTVRATGRGSDKSSGGKVGNARSYFAQLMASLNRYKRYPAESKKQKQQGIVNVLFTIDQQGNVISRSIKKSSGHPQLDQAALVMFDAASPLPAIPEFMQRNSLTLVLPVDFSLITNNAFKE